MRRSTIYSIRVLLTIAACILCGSLWVFIPMFLGFIFTNLPKMNLSEWPDVITFPFIMAAFYAYMIVPILLMSHLSDVIWRKQPKEITGKENKTTYQKPKEPRTPTTRPSTPKPAKTAPSAIYKPPINRPVMAEDLANPAWREKNRIESIINPPVIAEDSANPAWRGENGTETTIRPAQPEIEVALLHKRMQDEIIHCLLRENAPERKVYREYKNVDVLVHDKDVYTLIEIKTEPNIWKNIRDGIGQLLEYQFTLKPYLQYKKNTLIIVSPPEIEDKAQEYLTYLNSTGKLEIQYKKYVPGSFFFRL